MNGWISRRLYRRILLLYPEHFRREFEDEMLGMFEECSAAQGSLRLLADVGLSAAKQQIQYLSTPVPKSALLYTEIASSPNLARMLAVIVCGAALVAGVSMPVTPKAPESCTMLRTQRRFRFPAIASGQFHLPRGAERSTKD
jgi:hypothetical protein